MSRPVVCLGELVVDVFDCGPEVPGGAPSNVAYHAASLGVPAQILSRVGNDEYGAMLRRWVAESGVDAAGLQTDPAWPTGTVLVNTKTPGAPTYEIPMPVAYDMFEADAAAMGRVGAASVVVFGTSSQRHPTGRTAFRRLVEASRLAGAVVVADLNLRPPHFDEETVLWSLRHADVLKLNDDELRTVSGMLGARGEVVELFAGLLREFGLSRGMLTLGADGAWVAEEGRLVHVSSPRVEVVDTVGAGDAFCGVMCAALRNGCRLAAAAPWAARVAAFVCSQPGATPGWPAALQAEAAAAVGMGGTGGRVG